MGAFSQIIKETLSDGMYYNQRTAVVLGQPFGVTTRSLPTGFQLLTSAGFAPQSSISLMIPFESLATWAQPTRTHLVYHIRPPPIPVTQGLPSGQVGPSTGPSPMADTTTGHGPGTNIVDGRGRGWHFPEPTLPLGHGRRPSGYRYPLGHDPYGSCSSLYLLVTTRVYVMRKW